MKARVALLASIVSLCMVAFVAAQVSTTTGTVVSNSGGMLVVDTDSGQRTFMVDAQSSLPANLAAGTRVTVEYHTLANDKFHAFKVTPASGIAPTTPTDTAPSMTGTTGATAPAPATGAMQQQPTTTAPTETTRTETTTPTDTTATTADDASTTGRTLPATASPLPLMALAGGLALAGGALLRRLRA